MRVSAPWHIGFLAGTCLIFFGLWPGAAAIAQTGQETGGLRPIRVVGAVFSPYVYVKPDGSVSGFAVELIRAIAARAGRPVEFRIVDNSPQAVALVKAGEADVIPALASTPDRLRVLSFAAPLDTTNVVLEALKTRAEVFAGANLADLRIGVKPGYSMDVLSKLDIKPVPINDLDAMLTALNRGEIDLVATAEIEWHRVTQLFGVENDYVQVGPPLASTAFGFAVDKNQPELLAFLEAGLLSMGQDGTAATIRGQWLTDLPYWSATRLKTAIAFSLGFALLSGLGLFAWTRARRRALVLSEARSREALAVAHARELEIANARLTRANERLSESHTEMERVLYAVTHDLKSPLVTARGFAGVLEEAASEGDVEGMLDASRRVLSSTAKFGVITDALLEFGRYQQAEVVRRPIDVAHALNNVRMMLQSEIERTGAIIELRRPVDPLTGDPAQVLRVLLNLVGNALRYGCPEPGMRIEVSTERRADGTVVTVRDHGPGVPDDQKKLIFGLFRRYGKVSSESTGLGLAIVEKIARKHGGNAWVEDAEGGGAVFCVFLADPETSISPEYERKSS